MALLLFSGLLALALAEVAVRIVAPQQLILIKPDLWQPADTIGWVHRPNASVQINTGERTVSVMTDREGFRIGRDGRREAPTRVLLLGDSFMEALQVENEQTTADLLEKALEQRLGKPVVVRNAGIVGWDPNHYFLRARQLLSRDTFDLVVVSIFVGNDAVPKRFDYLPPRSPADRRHLRMPHSLAPAELIDAFLTPVNDALEERSQAFNLFKNQLSTLRMRLGLTAQYFPAEYLRSEASSPRWKLAADRSRELADLAAQHDAPTLFALIPESFQVYADVFHQYVQGFKIDPASVDLEQPTRRLAEEFRADSLTFIDVLPAFRAAAAADSGRGPRLYGRVDTHFAPRAHALLASLLAQPAAELLTRGTMAAKTPAAASPRRSGSIRR